MPAKASLPTIEQLTEEFLERYRRGELPAIAEYTTRYPELADEIRDVFAALVLVEEAGPQELARPAAYSGQITPDGKEPRQLGDYRIIREVGRGGMGVVYEAIQETLGRHVALKVLPYEASANPSSLERFTREARSAARLHHTNIVPVFDVGHHLGMHYYAMQFIQGHGLDEVLLELRRLRSSKSTPPPEKMVAFSLAEGVLSGRFAAVDAAGLPGQGEHGGQSSASPVSSPPIDALTPVEHDDAISLSTLSTQSAITSDYYRSVARLGLQVAEALGCAHAEKVLHRDIKPSNLLLDVRGTIWVTDFGLAKEEGAELTKPGDVVGTLRYLAPERFSGVSEPRGDIYSLGLTLYEMLTLRPAFDEQDRARLIRRITHEEPPPPRRLDCRIPRDLETVVLKATAKEPKNRYQRADDLAEDLRRYLADRPILARRASWRDHAWRWAHRNPGWAATLIATLGLLLVSAVGGLVLSLHLQNALWDARAAETDKTEKLWQSLVERAAAKRAGGRVGQRFEALQAIRAAAKIRVTQELRNEATAALVLADVEPAQAWECCTDDTIHCAVDVHYQRCVTLDRHGGLTLFRLAAEGATKIASLPAHGRPPFGHFWTSPDGRFIAYGHSLGPGQAGVLRVVRLDGPTLGVLLDDPGGWNQMAAAFRADGKQLAVGHADGFVTIYELETGQRLRRLHLGAAPQTLAFHPRDGRLAAACGNVVRLFDVDAERELPALRHGNDVGWIHGLAWHPDGRRLAAGGDDRKIHVWDTETATEIMRPWEGHDEDGIGLSFNHAGDRLVSADWGRNIRLWDAVTGRLLLAIPTGLAIQFSADDYFLGYERDGNKIRAWRLDPGRELRVLRRRQATAGEIVFSPVVQVDGPLLAASVQSSAHNWLGFFDIESGEQVALVGLPDRNSPPVECRSYVPTDGWLSAGTSGLLLWSVRPDPEKPNGFCIGPPKRLAPHRSFAGAAASRDGHILSLPHPKGAVAFNRESAGQPVFLGPQSDVRNCAVSPDGSWVVTGSHWWDGRTSAARIWDAASGRHVHDLPLEGSTVPGFSPDGRWLGTKTADVGFKLWEVGTWQEKYRFRDGAFAFSADSRLVAVGDVVGAIRLIEPDSGREVARLSGPEPTRYQPVAMTTDGTRLIATGSGSKALYVWDLRQLRARLKEMELDWEWPEFPAVDQPKEAGKYAFRIASPPNVRVDAGFFKQPVLRDDRQAIAVYSLALALCPLNPPAYLERARAHWRMKRYQSARDDLEKLLALGTDFVGPERQLALLCNNVAWHEVTVAKAEGRAVLALSLAKKADELEPYNGYYRNTLGVAYYRLGRYQEAVDALEGNSKLYPELTGFDGYVLAMSYHQLGNPASALGWFERSDKWAKQQSRLPDEDLAELAAFRAEAATLFGITSK
jgi:serine/threonine protein kinase/WD40 repeat protein